MLAKDYNNRVENTLNKIMVLYALVEIKPGSKINMEDIGVKNVSSDFISQNKDIVDSMNYIRNDDWYVKYDTVIEKGSFIYKYQLEK